MISSLKIESLIKFININVQCHSQSLLYLVSPKADLKVNYNLKRNVSHGAFSKLNTCSLQESQLNEHII